MIKTIYHGSKQIVKSPSLNKGKPNNDYGKGFYCTEDLELAKEWSVTFRENGYANIYQIDLDGLDILNLDDYCSLTWLAILVDNREFTVKGPIAKEAIKYLKKNFLINYRDYDIIYGYRADDSYFDFARSFINNVIPLETLEQALKLGNLGKQFVLISNKAFSRIKFVGYETADHEQYYLTKYFRDGNARKDYFENKYKKGKKDTYINEIIQKGMTANDFR